MTIEGILVKMSQVPAGDEAFDDWINLRDAIPFLQMDATRDVFLLYASLPNVFINTVLSPSSNLATISDDDYLNWNFNAYGSWGVSICFTEPPTITLEPPLRNTGSNLVDSAEKLVYAREFKGRLGDDHYIEISQKFLHVLELHFVEDRNAYCYFNHNGDLEDAIRVIELSTGDIDCRGTIVTVDRNFLDRYLILTKSVAVRTFDFTRLDISKFGQWHDGHVANFVEASNLKARCHVEMGHAGFLRGCQIVSPAMSTTEFQDHFNPTSKKTEGVRILHCS